MIRTVGSCDKSVRARPAKVIVIAAAGNADVLVDAIKLSAERAHRSIQNVGANAIYVAFGQDADDQFGYHKCLQSGQELDCTLCSQRVNVYSTAGSSVAVLEMTREDMTTHNTFVSGPAA